jgi:uncharacterized membrane protein
VLSAKKQQLAIAERFAICASASCIIVALLSLIDESFSKIALPVVLLAFGGMFYLALLITGLTTELNKALGRVSSTSGEGPYSSISEIRKQIQWSPRSYRLAALVAIVGIVGTAAMFGVVSWSTNQPFTSRHAIASSLYLCCILIIELPVIASASRMPGTYKDNISLLGEGDP